MFVVVIGPTKMRQIRYLFQNNYGTYYFRYTLPSWYILRFPKAQKWIYISLMTKDMEGITQCSLLANTSH